MKFKVSKTYETWSESDIDACDTDNRGFEYENQEFTFSELVREFDWGGALEASVCPWDDTQRYAWIYSSESQNFQTGERTSYAWHLSRDQQSDELCLKYWKRAFEAATKR